MYFALLVNDDILQMYMFINNRLFPILLLSTPCAIITRAIFNYEEHLLIDYCITTIKKNQDFISSFKLFFYDHNTTNGINHLISFHYFVNTFCNTQ